MAVDQARQMNFFREMINTNNINNNQIQISNNNNSYNESLLLPFYNLNDVVFATTGKLPPAVKDDSGVTFNNSLVLPSPVPVSRKRQRETPVLQQQQQRQQQHNPVVVAEKRSNGFCFLGEDLSLQIMQQQLELDRLVSQHMEKMRMEIEDRKKQQLRRIMAAIEEAMARKLKNKEEELEKIGKINFALEERVKSLIIENQIWRDLAQTNEATANALRTNLEQLLQQNNHVERPELTDDAVSCCGSSGYGGEGEEEEEQNDTKRRRVGGERSSNNEGGERWIYRGKNEGLLKGDGENNSHSKRRCRKCGEGESSVLLLPCRHLCLCTSCGPTVNSCPICNSAKNASVHVNLS